MNSLKKKLLDTIHDLHHRYDSEMYNCINVRLKLRKVFSNSASKMRASAEFALQAALTNHDFDKNKN